MAMEDLFLDQYHKRKPVWNGDFREHPYIKLFEVWRKQFPYRVNIPSFIKGHGKLNHPLLQHRYLQYEQNQSSEQVKTDEN